MALTCPRCGTQNPDGNRFCMSCGTPLAAPAPQPQQVAAPAAAPPPAAYQSPYYAPPPGTGAAVVHRTPWVLIISIVVAVVLVLSAVGTVLAFTLGRSNSQATNFSVPSSPSPISSPSAGQTPESSPSPTSQPTGASSVSTSGETVALPDGWQVVNKDDTSVTLQSPDGDGVMTIASGAQSPPATAEQLEQQIVKAIESKYADAAGCPGTSVQKEPIAGVNGISWVECFTLTSGGQAIPVGEPIWVGANASGSVAYVVVLQTSQDNIETFIKECVPILDHGITWKLK